MKKSDDRAAEVRSVYHVYGYTLNWTKSSYQLIIKITISEKEKQPGYERKERKFALKDKQRRRKLFNCLIGWFKLPL